MNEKSVPEQAQAVVASPNMVPPNLRKALEKRDYTTRPDAPATHARLWGDPDGNAYHLMFNGADLVTLRYPDGVRPGLRLHSDGDFQSVPFVQQFLAWADQDAPMEVEFTSPVEMWNMRPQRAQGGQAILGQTGHPLLFGVNGLYFPDWDLLLSFHGLPFAWTAPRIERAHGQWRARLRVTLGKRPGSSWCGRAIIRSTWAMPSTGPGASGPIPSPSPAGARGKRTTAALRRRIWKRTASPWPR